MKIIKLDRRHTANRVYGFSHAVRFDRGWSREARTYEQAAKQLFGHHDFAYETSSWAGIWNSHKDRKTGYFPYSLCFRNEQDITMLLVKVGPVSDE